MPVQVDYTDVRHTEYSLVSCLFQSGTTDKNIFEKVLQYQKEVYICNTKSKKMKIAVYQIETVTPKDESEYEEICDILGTPTLKYGVAEFVGKLSHWITKTELKQMNKVAQRYYDKAGEFWRDGVLLLNTDRKYFAQYAGDL